ncbi:MAG: glycosyltransferase family 4 protein [Candidatus Bathyarchaeia archaeon]
MTSALYPDVIGGHAIHSMELSSLQAKAGHSVSVITCKRKKQPEYERMFNFEVFRLKRVTMPWDLFGLDNPVLPSLASTIAQLRPDIVDAQSHLFWTTYAAVKAANKIQVPVITTVHGIIAERRFAVNAAQWAYIYTFGMAALRDSTVVVCLSKSDMQQVGNLGIPLERIRVVPLGVRTDLFHPSSQPSKSSILWAGRFVREKGLEDLVLAAGLVKKLRPDLKFILVGDGPEKSMIVSKIRHLNLTDTVSTVGSESQEFVADQLRKCLCLVLPSRREGLPRILLETMSCGKPIIASDLPSIREMTAGAAILVPPNSPEALSKAILRIAETDWLRRELGNAGLERVKEKYAWEVVLPKLEELYNQVLEA